MLSPKELDQQCRIKISRWVDIFSQECREMDNDHQLTIKWFKLLQGDTLLTDRDGRVWGKGKDNYWYPFHFEYGKSLIGYRVSARAAN